MPEGGRGEAARPVVVVVEAALASVIGRGRHRQLLAQVALVQAGVGGFVVLFLLLFFVLVFLLVRVGRRVQLASASAFPPVQVEGGVEAAGDCALSNGQEKKYVL